MARSNYTIWFIIGLLLIGCETDKIVFSDPNHVRFTKTAISEKESYSKIIQLEVHVAGPVPDDDLTINYSISGDARENVDYVILGERGKVLIEEGEYFGYIDIQLINNANNIIREQDIVLTLTSISGGSLSLGQGEGDIGKQCVFTIVDDCILGGYYKGQQNSLQIPIENITISSSDCITYRLSNWNIYVFGEPFDFGLNFVDNGDNTLTIPLQDEGTSLQGIGTVDPVSREIFISITLVDDNETVTFTLKPE